MAQDTSGQEVETAVNDLFEATPGPETQGTETQGAETSESTHADGGESPDQQQTQAEVFAEIAGRKYSTKEDLFKSHENLNQQLSKLQNELKGEREWGKPWRGWEKFLRENPDFYRQLKGAEQKYRSARQAGASDAQAKRYSGVDQLPPEIQKKLQKVDEHDRYFQEQKQRETESTLQMELTALQTAQKLDDATMKQVTGIMLQIAKDTGIDISAEKAFRLYKAEAHNDELQQTKEELKRTRGADSAPTTGAPAKTAKKDPAKMGNREFDDFLKNTVDGMNLPD